MTATQASRENPRVLFVDDSDLLSPSLLRDVLGPLGVAVRLRHPEATVRTDLEWATLIVVDYFLSEWAERDETASMARSPFNGLAAAAALRSATLPPLEERTAGAVPPRPVAFALWSSNLREATFYLPDVVLPHVFSRENNLEWAFRREDLLQESGGQQISLLAHAVDRLPVRWPAEPDDAELALLELLDLGIDDDSWHSDARRDVLNCRPPMHELSERSHGLALLRWLLHRIFPYPAFLLDEPHLAARLKVDALGVDEISVDLRAALEQYEYTGILAGFSGARWWRAGIEDWLFDATGGSPADTELVSEVSQRLGATTSQTWIHPVVTLNADLQFSGIAEADEAVRIRPDDWPVFADDGFARIADVLDEPALRALVDMSDRERLS